MSTAKMLLYFAVIIMGIVLVMTGNTAVIRIMGALQILLVAGLFILKVSKA